MGLDMYLKKVHYISTSDVKKKLPLMVGGLKGVNAARVKCIEEEVMYWRKFNALHKWFVDNVQDGNDDCRDYDVDGEALEKVAVICEQLLAAPEGERNELAAELLPSQSGFFFGGTEYDEYYWEDVKMTAEGLRALLAEPEPDDHSVWYSYHSSW